MKTKKVIIGKIINAGKQETATVLVERLKKHPKYKKQFKISKKYLVHNPENKFNTGETVSIFATRPISKRKKFVILSNNKEK